MNFYSIRDRFLNYYMTPFVGESDRPVIAAVAALINSGETTDAIAKAPQHFEIWRIAKVDDQTGEVTADREFIADCGSLIRRGIRKDATTGNPNAATAAQPGGEQPRSSADGKTADQRAVAAALEPEDRTPPNACDED